jgi:hypothetical protein
MKNLLLLFLAVPLLSFSQEKDNDKFIGKWIGNDQMGFGYITFDSEGYAYFEIEGITFGGKEFTLEGKKGSMTYEINSTTNPIQVDFTITKLESGEQRKILCIANFIDDNSMQFALSFEENRPTNFNGENAIVFERGK